MPPPLHRLLTLLHSLLTLTVMPGAAPNLTRHPATRRGGSQTRLSHRASWWCRMSFAASGRGGFQTRPSASTSDSRSPPLPLNPAPVRGQPPLSVRGAPAHSLSEGRHPVRGEPARSPPEGRVEPRTPPNNPRPEPAQGLTRSGPTTHPHTSNQALCERPRPAPHPPRRGVPRGRPRPAPAPRSQAPEKAPAAPQEFFRKNSYCAREAPIQPPAAPTLAAHTDRGAPRGGIARMNLVGYTDRLTAAPGDTVRFMVSSRHPRFRADLVRLIHGDESPAGPGFKERQVPSAIDGEYPGRSKPIHSGSYVHVPRPPRPRRTRQLHRHRLALPHHPPPPASRVSSPAGPTAQTTPFVVSRPAVFRRAESNHERPQPRQTPPVLRASPSSSAPTATSPSTSPTARTHPSTSPPAPPSPSASGPSSAPVTTPPPAASSSSSNPSAAGPSPPTGPSSPAKPPPPTSADPPTAPSSSPPSPPARPNAPAPSPRPTTASSTAPASTTAPHPQRTHRLRRPPPRSW